MKERTIMIMGYETIIENQINVILQYKELGFSFAEKKHLLKDLETELSRFIKYIESESE
jgi:hypothetical protein